MLTYSNPRTKVIIEDWPFGSLKTKAEFYLETCPRTGRERICRVVTNPKTGRKCAPKKLTYAKRMRIVDGSDGPTYIIEDNTDYGHITVMQGTMDKNRETIYGGKHGRKDIRFDEVFALFDEQFTTLASVANVSYVASCDSSP